MSATSAPVDTPAAAPARSRWLWIALVGSLAINAVLIGMVARTLWQVRAHVAIGSGSLEATLPAFVNTLPAERRDELRRAGVPARTDGLRPLRREIRQTRSEAARIFRADPFDKAAFLGAQNRLFDAEARLHQALQKLLPEIGEQMTAAERRGYMSWRGRGYSGGYRRSEGGGKGRPEEPGSGPGSRRP